MFNRTLGVAGRYRRAIAIFFVLILLILVTSHHIGSSTLGLSPAEAASKSQSAGLRAIAHDPLNLAHKLVEYIAININPQRKGLLRLSSYLFGLAFSAAFYYLARSWFGRPIGFLSTLLFCLSPFFLVPSRVASFQIMFFWPIALMAAYHWLGKTDRKNWAWFAFILVVGASLYTPGLIWLLLGAVAICYKKLLSIFHGLRREAAIGGLVLFILLLVPAGWAIFSDWHFIKSLAAIPVILPHPLTFIKYLAWMVLALFIKTPYHDPLMIGRLPILDLLQLGLLVFGAYAMYTAARTKLAAYGALIGLAVILAALNYDTSYLLICLPALGVLMAAGLRYLHIEWRSVFPRNPIPKTLALILMSVLVGIQLTYGISYSFIAWPHTPDTKTIYVLK